MCTPISIRVTAAITEASSGDDGIIVCGKQHMKELVVPVFGDTTRLTVGAGRPVQGGVASSRGLTALNARKSNRAYLSDQR